VESLIKLNGDKRIPDYKMKIKQNLPNIITILRLIVLPYLIYSFYYLDLLVTSSIFLASIVTDLLDGYVARKLKVTSKIGAYLDVIVDFLFIFGMYVTFVLKEIYSPWILLVIVFIFTQFVISNIILKQTIYDPIGKYYGSILFGGIGITILSTEQQIIGLITSFIIIAALLSLLSRFYYLTKRKYQKTRWKCPNCSGIIEFYHYRCSNCGFKKQI
jgi:phosphatidylglycerophosphate synthase